MTVGALAGPSPAPQWAGPTPDPSIERLRAATRKLIDFEMKRLARRIKLDQRSHDGIRTVIERCALAWLPDPDRPLPPGAHAVLDDISSHLATVCGAPAYDEARCAEPGP